MVGRTISHYRILDKIGEGGMGVVYKAEDTRLDRTVALKFLAAHLLESEEHKERFLREAKAAASLDHPNIATVYEVGEAEGHVFLVMGYIDGPEVRAKVKERPLKLEEALDIAIQAAEGLQAAHQKGVVHRDIKSSNLMLSSSGQVKLMDFGLAQLAGASRLTRADSSVGTPAYMSPEQAQRLPTDRRTDIWSLGVVLYEMVTGRLPFEGEREEAALYSIVHEPHEAVTAIRAGVPLELDRVLSKALAKKPGERYQHIEDMLVDLRALRGKSLVSSRVTVPRPLIRRRVGWAGVGALAVALALLVGPFRDRFAGLRPGVTGVPQIASIAVLPLGNFSGDPEQEYFSDGLTENLIANLAKIGALKVTSRTSVMQYKQTEKPLREIASELGVDAVVEGSAQQSGDRVRMSAQLIDAKTDQHLWADTYDRPVTDAFGLPSEVAREIARQIRVTVTPEQETRLTSARKVNPKVYEAYLRGMFYVSQNTPESFEKGMKFLHEAVAIDPAEPLGYIGLAEGYTTLGHGGAEDPESFPRARAAAEQALKLDPNAAEAVGALADVALYYEWDWEKAERLFKRAFELNPSLAMTHYHYAWYLALFDRLDEAIEEHKLARDLDPLRALNTALLGQLYNYAGRYDEAIVEAKKALELDPEFAASYVVMALAYSHKGMHKEAITAAQRLVELNPQEVTLLALAYLRAGQREQALALAGKRDSLPNDFGWAIFYAALGDRDEALRRLEACYERHPTQFPWIRVRGFAFDSLRDDPRFQDLLRRMNLPP